MRISRLDLLRYGKFTDQVVSFPNSARDFHFVVGANEAGKSTVRSAILDLLFGIEMRSAYDFLHPYAEMVIGAAIESANEHLEFRRVKKKLSLITLSGLAMQEDALTQFIGKTDRAFFDQMFGLDHKKLVAGGEEILDSSNDIGQLLFQSAAGIASLGEIRDAFELEANGLWAKTKTSKRAYYAAADELAIADATLKGVLVRTKEWAAAQSRVKDLHDELEKSKVAHCEAETRRVCLERVRRVGPSIQLFQSKYQELNDLGPVIALPADAGQIFQKSEIELAKAEQEKTVFENQVRATRELLSTIEVDNDILKFQIDISALSQRRQQVRNHDGDIIKRQAEAQIHWNACVALARQLGWTPVDEEALRGMLPPVPVRSAIANLAKGAALLEQTLISAREASRDKASELLLIEEQLRSIPDAVVPLSMKTALSAARALGDVKAHGSGLASAVAKLSRELVLAKEGLGEWYFETEELRRFALPPNQEVEGFSTRLATQEKARSAQVASLKDVEDAIRDQELEIAQYRDQHHPVSTEELLEARAKRDDLWSLIRSGASKVLDVAEAYEGKVMSADKVADRHSETAHEQGELQGKLNNVVRLKLNVSNMQARIKSATVDEARILSEWTSRISRVGLVGMPIHLVGPWRESRDRVLRAKESLEEAEAALLDHKNTHNSATTKLYDALVESGIAIEKGAPLSILIDAAAEAVDLAARAQVRRGELLKQRGAASASKVLQEERAAAAVGAKVAWETEWRKHVVSATLDGDVHVGVAEGALRLFEQIEEELDTIRSIRTTRIETMQEDLSAFAKDASVLTAAVAVNLTGQPAPAVADSLQSRLARAKSAEAEWTRIQRELKQQDEQLATAAARSESANSTLAPLMLRANASIRDDLDKAIMRSDTWRILSSEVAAAKKAVLEAGDGLTLDALQAELHATNLSQIAADLAEVTDGRNELQRRQNAISAELATATAELSKIAGQDEAAKAESSRQDALSKMADSAERYIKIHTAARLLRWSIDRYREQKQGPMLERASEIFRAVTLGSFKKLIVDFDALPLALEGQRDDGKRVKISGMSDGTRDQLYLALRLAALELHFSQALPLPFIADDLFINFDDDRATAGLHALAKLSEKTQVIFLSHHDHLMPMVESVFGKSVNVVKL